MTAAPAVAVVVPTRDRPELLRGTVESILAQDYPGQVDVFVVYDGTTPDISLQRHGAGQRQRSVQVLVNTRTPGLAGARNSGICSCGHPLVSFCDDDDTWSAGKLTAQVAELSSRPDLEMCSSGIEVDFDGHRTARLAGSDVVLHQQLLRSRMAMLHSSTFLFRRAALVEGIGLVDERIPGGQNEDWDLLLRASARRPVAVVDRALVRVRWGRTSHYARQWETKVSSLSWMLAHHPDLAADAVGAARVYGQIAFALACTGQRRQALQWAGRATRRHPQEWRAAAAALVACRVTSGERLLEVLHRFGRGV